MPSIALFVGLWMTTCIQTQIDLRKGFMTESYQIENNGQYQYKKTWFEDSECKLESDQDIEFGQITQGSRIQGIFMSDKSLEANFHTEAGVDLGALSISTENNLKVARGFKGSSFRNTMLSIFDYVKEKDL